MLVRSVGLATLALIAVTYGVTTGSPQESKSASATSGEPAATTTKSTDSAVISTNGTTLSFSTNGAASADGEKPATTIENAPSVIPTNQPTGTTIVAVKPAESMIKVFAVRSAQASELCGIVHRLFGDDQRLVRCEADPRTNSIVMMGQPDMLEIAGETIAKLDIPGKETDSSATEAVAIDLDLVILDKPGIDQTRLDLLEHETAAAKHAEKLRELNAKLGKDHPEVIAAQKAVGLEVKMAFDARQALHKAQLAQLNRRLSELQKRTEDRAQREQEIIERRIQQLIHQSSGGDKAAEVDGHLDIELEFQREVEIEGDTPVGKKRVTKKSPTKISVPVAQAVQKELRVAEVRANNLAGLAASGNDAMLDLVKEQLKAHAELQASQAALDAIQHRLAEMQTYVAELNNKDLKVDRQQDVAEYRTRLDQLAAVEAEHSYLRRQVESAKQMKAAIEHQLETTVQLLQLDVERSKAELDIAAKQMADRDQAAQAGLISTTELEEAKLNLKRAEVELQKRMVMFESLQKFMEQQHQANSHENANHNE